MITEAIAVAALAAIAHGGRLRIFRALVGASPGGMSPGALSAMLDIPGSTLSFHLKELSAAGLIEAQRQGRNIVYRARLDRMGELLAYLTAHCCEGGAPGSCGEAAAFATCVAGLTGAAPHPNDDVRDRS